LHRVSFYIIRIQNQKMVLLSPKSLLSLTLLLNPVAALLSAGKCHTLKDGSIQLKSNFERAKYVGRWFEQSKSADFPLEWGQICGTEDYFKRSDGNIQVHFRAYANNFMHWPKLDTTAPIACTLNPFCNISEMVSRNSYSDDSNCMCNTRKFILYYCSECDFNMN
jgi:hypothetical protein